MNYPAINEHIANWLKEYSETSGTDGYVVGISGGIDSALTSTLCAMTGRKVIALSMPIHQTKKEHSRGVEHMQWLKNNFPNVELKEVELTSTFDHLKSSLNDVNDHLTLANTRARLRMTTLYAIGQQNGLLVAGTGNKVEDFGIGFFTKYGDGGVDVNPIADLYKTKVIELAKELGVVQSIIDAPPTDGLWEDERSDEDQIGATYQELEWAMEFRGGESELDEREKEVLSIYDRFHKKNLHKMRPIPVCKIPKDLK